MPDPLQQMISFHFEQKNQFQSKIMKQNTRVKALLLFAFVILARSSDAQEKPMHFSLKGKIKDIGEQAKIIISYPGAGKYKSDTTSLVKGEFEFSGVLTRPVKALIYIKKSTEHPRMMVSIGYTGEVFEKDGRWLYLDQGNLSLAGETLKSSVMSGSPDQKNYDLLQEQLKPTYDKIKGLETELVKLRRKKINGIETTRLTDSISQLLKKTEPVKIRFIKTHLESYVAWDLVSGQGLIDNPDTYQKLVYQFGDKFLKSASGQNAIKRLEGISKVAIGQPAPEFTQENQYGKPVSLENFKGKYVLIDFWASWCGPCREENPNIVKAYEKYKSKNFEIVGVSLDTKRDAWMKAIKDDRLSWVQVSDLKGWKNSVSRIYSVEAVPQNFLIDPNGKIIAKNLKGAALEERLSTLFNY